MKTITFKCDDNFYKEVYARAELDRSTVTELIKKSITEYLYKDVNIQNELLGALEQTQSNIKTVKDEFSLFYSLFVYYLKYYFALSRKELDTWRTQEDIGKDTKLLSENSKYIFKQNLEKGEETKEKFLNAFKKQSPRMRNLIDVLMAGCLEEEKN